MTESTNTTAIKARFRSAMIQVQDRSKLCAETGGWCTPDQVAVAGANGRGNTRGNKLLKKLYAVVDQVLYLDLTGRGSKPSLEQEGLMIAITGAADLAIINNANPEGAAYIVHLDMIKDLINLCNTLIATTKGFSFGRFALGVGISIGIGVGVCYVKKHFFDDDA